MKVYSKTGSEPAWLCGHWNGSPVEIGMGLRKEVGANEVMHSHPYCEYYIAIEGEAELKVGNDQVTLAPGCVVMVEPGEKHMVTSVGKDGAFWVVVKARSEPGTKIVSSTETDDAAKR